jgi:hypothetical protein
MDTNLNAVRVELQVAVEQTRTDLSNPGDWLSGSQRLEVVAEARNAWRCGLCDTRKSALSPYRVEGNHDSVSVLPEIWIELIHRVVTDSSRITQAWYESIIGDDLCEDEFIEILSVTCITTSVDVLSLGLGVDPLVLSEPNTGTPARTRPSGANPGPGWAWTVAPEDAGPELAGFYDFGPYYIRRALTLVPREAERFWNLMNELYLPDPAAEGVGKVERGISRAQIEFLAARVSALLGCYY